MESTGLGDNAGQMTIPGPEATGTTEAVPTPAPLADPTQKDLFADKFARLAARERKAQQERQAFDTQKSQFTKDQEELAQLRAWKQKAKEDPMLFLDEGGLTYDEITQAALKLGPHAGDSEVKKLAQEIADLKNERQKEKSSAEDQARQKEIDNFKSGLDKFITDTSDYELIAANNASESVYELIMENYRNTFDPTTKQGEILSYKDACDMVENHLESQLAKLATTKKFSSKFASLSQTPSPAQPVNTAPQTITSRMGVVSEAAPSSTRVSDEELMKRSAAQLKWL